MCRGNRRQVIFLDDTDRRRYLWLLAEVRRDCGWRIPAYCLMGNHVHLVAEVPEGTISRGMQWLNGRYGQAFNVRHGVSGHVFQGRFRSERVEDERYAVDLVRYVDLNPERAGLVGDAAEWPWSSYRALAGLAEPRSFHDVGWLLDRLAPTRERAHAAYAAFVAEGRSQPLPPTLDTSPPPTRGQTPGRDR